MRAILHTDVVAAARVLRATPKQLRPEICQRMLREAHWADSFVKRTGKLHQRWGNGTLRSAAYARELAQETDLGTEDYATCFILVLEQVISRSWSALE